MDEFDEVEGRSGRREFLTDPRGVIQRRWPWMLAVFLVTSLAAGAFVATIPETYQATASLLLAQQRIPEDFVRRTSLEGVPEMLNAVVGEILSRESLMAVAQAQNLAERMTVHGSQAKLIQQMRKAITIEQDREMESQSQWQGTPGAFVLAIRFESPDPVIAADVANELASHFTSTQLRRQSRQARLTSDFLRREADRAEVELAEQRARITEFQEAHRGELPSELPTKLARLERLQQASQSLALQISDAEGRLLILRGQAPVPDARGKLLEDLRARLVHERTLYTDEHPNVTAIRRQIEALEAEIADERARSGIALDHPDVTAAAVQRELESLRAQLRDARREMQELDASVAAIPAREEALAALEQREQLLRERFTDASRKVQEAELAENLQRAQQGFQVSQLDVATPAVEPTRTRLMFAVLAAGAVLVASLVTGFLLEVVDPVVLTSRQLEKETGMIPLGVIPRIR